MFQSCCNPAFLSALTMTDVSVIQQTPPLAKANGISMTDVSVILHRFQCTHCTGMTDVSIIQQTPSQANSEWRTAKGIPYDGCF